MTLEAGANDATHTGLLAYPTRTQGSARRATLGLCDTIPLGLADLAGLSDVIPVGIGCFPVRRMPKHQALSSLGGGEGEAAASRAGPTLIQQPWGRGEGYVVYPWFLNCRFLKADCNYSFGPSIACPSNCFFCSFTSNVP